MRLAEFVRKAIDFRLTSVRTAIPVEVISYDAAANTVDVKPLIEDVIEAEDGLQVDPLAVLTAVPVAHPRGGGFFVAVPLAKGDTGQIIVCDRSIDDWHKRGGEVIPLDRRQHTHAGAVFHPGLSDSTNPIAEASATDLVIGEEGGSTITIKPGGQMEIGGAPTDYVALSSLVATELAKILSAISGAAVLAGDGGATFKAAIVAALAGFPSSVAAGKVKAD